MYSTMSAITEWGAPYVGTGVTAILLLFAFLQTGPGAKIFDATFRHYFDRKLTDLKHEQDRKLADIRHVYERNIEELRAELSHFTDRSKLSNEREYQALIASWEGFIEAYYSTRACVARFHSFPDLTHMPNVNLDEFLEFRKISTPNRQYIKESDNRNSAYSRVEDSKVQNEAQSAIWAARDAMRKQSVFIPSDIEQKFEEAFNVLQKVWAEQHVRFGWGDATAMGASMDLIGNGGEAMKSALRDVVRKRVLKDATAPAS